ncbi:hypothetical protein J2794_006406 [Paraburkholderia terricola]|uniref:hypothetical protein n=1 Tax=Paraburkholderia terricola TaxID=169427 RepID=UPI002856C6DA|nr:hypothetical protein [Paraburkholderia terricola]MDR6450265.1 hypothetical protein [Paraburkholderia terricola]
MPIASTGNCTRANTIFAKKEAKLIAQQLGISVEDAEGRIVEEFQPTLMTEIFKLVVASIK